MNSPRTVETNASVADFIASAKPEVRRRDSIVLCDMMERVTGRPPRMWGSSIVGFDHYDYRTRNGTAGRWPITGFSPRKSGLSIYIMPGFANYANLLARLGKHRTGVSCLYVTRLSDIVTDVLEELVVRAVAEMRNRYPAGKTADS